MRLIKAESKHIAELVRISKEAFDSDTEVGADSAGGPPEYDNVKWHIKMMNEGHLFTAEADGKIIGGAIIFINGARSLYVGRIFVAPQYFRQGFGAEIMKLIEQNNPSIKKFELDTPIWNIRTNGFYKKLGYNEIRRDEEFVYYKKVVE